MLGLSEPKAGVVTRIVWAAADRDDESLCRDLQLPDQEGATASGNSDSASDVIPPSTMS